MLGPIFFGRFFPCCSAAFGPICLVMTGYMTCKRARAGMQTLRFAARSGLRSRHGRVMTHASRRAHAHPHPPTRARTDATHHSIHPHPSVFSPRKIQPITSDPHPGKTKYTPPPLNFVSLKFEISVLWFCRVVLVLIDWKPLSVYWSGTTHRRKI